MLYNYYLIIVLILLLPVTLNIVLPLMMLAIWLLKQLVVGSRKRLNSSPNRMKNAG